MKLKAGSAGATSAPDPVAPTVVLSPSEQLRPLSEGELDVLEQIGSHWAEVLRGRGGSPHTLPVDPSLRRYAEAASPTRFGRIARVRMFKQEAPDEVVETEQAGSPRSRPGGVLHSMRRLMTGPPLRSSAVMEERMRKLVALPVLASDLLSSVAYGPQAMLMVLMLAGTAALALALPISVALIVLMVAVGTSYRQTIRAYPSGAGSYLVASDNLGPRAGLAAGAGLLTDYVLTVSVSIAAGIQAITSAIPSLTPYTVELGLIAIAILLAGNLRGVRQAGYLFAAPTYAFLVAMFALIGFGLAKSGAHGFAVTPPPAQSATEAVTLFLIVRAFASGATSMTGIEAVSNALPVMRPVEWRNGRTVLTVMVGLLIFLFAGLMILFHLGGIVPQANETMLSQLAHRTFGGGSLYAYVQITTALILLLAANTAFNDFPRLLFFMARDYYAPRAFLRMGDRLGFSNGIIVLAVAAATIFAVLGGRTEALIPLYAVGVFLAFTLSQAGMVVHWWRRRTRGWRRSMAINGLGATLSAVVAVAAAVTKFTEGAWIVVFGIPLAVLVCLRIRRHYDVVGRALALHALPPTARGRRFVPAPEAWRRPPQAKRPAVGQEQEESPEEIDHLAIVPIARMDLASLHALAYAASLGQPVLAVHISPDEDEATDFRRQWQRFGDPLPLEIVDSPYRAIVAPLVHYLEALHAHPAEVTLTVVLPEIVSRHLWTQILHNQVAGRLRRALRPLPGVVVTTVPFHVSG
jgi:amino acid transporter